MIGRHATEEKRRIAESGLILRCQVGSGVHGTSISGQDDRDEPLPVKPVETSGGFIYPCVLL
jgi:hypothetical protein